MFLDYFCPENSYLFTSVITIAVSVLSYFVARREYRIYILEHQKVCVSGRVD